MDEKGNTSGVRQHRHHRSQARTSWGGREGGREQLLNTSFHTHICIQTENTTDTLILPWSRTALIKAFDVPALSLAAAPPPNPPSYFTTLPPRLHRIVISKLDTDELVRINDMPSWLCGLYWTKQQDSCSLSTYTVI